MQVVNHWEPLPTVSDLEVLRRQVKAIPDINLHGRAAKRGMLHARQFLLKRIHPAKRTGLLFLFWLSGIRRGLVLRVLRISSGRR